jgi:tRNA modification GTPase
MFIATSLQDTIVALATAPGKAGVAVLRLSGPQAKAALTSVSGLQEPTPRTAHYLPFRGADGIIDRGLALYFPAPHSFTGEEVVELHLHGSRAVVQEMLAILTALPEVRLAEPGEFSRRAFLHGKMDLTEAEGLADLIDAETRTQRQLALRQMSGELRLLYDGWRAQLLQAMALLEAYLDFPDEDIPPQVVVEMEQSVRALQASITAHLADNRRGERIRDGVHVAIIGPPNAGKSTLLNFLAQRDVAIVSETAGTTRDIVEVHLELAGLPVTFADTAGIRQSTDAIEQEGVRRATARAGEADITLAVLDIRTAAEDYPTIAPLLGEGAVVVLNKVDLARSCQLPVASLQKGNALRVGEKDASNWQLATDNSLPLSLHTHEGTNALLTTLETMVRERFTPGHQPTLTRLRHRRALEATLMALTQFAAEEAPELRAENLRMAAGSLGSLTGHISVEEILDQVFGQFCIGK